MENSRLPLYRSGQDVQYEVLEEIGSAREQIDIRGASMVAIDIEMFGQDVGRLHVAHGKFASLALALDNGRNYVVTNERVLAEALEMVAGLHWIIQNATYDLRQLMQFVEIQPRPIYDPMLVEKVLWGGYYMYTGLAAMARRYLGVYAEKDKYEEIRTETISPDELYSYNVKDALLTLDVAKEQSKLLDVNPGLSRVYQTLDSKMIWVVLDMQPTRVDVRGWLDLATENESKGRSIEAEIGVNVYSPKKVIELLATNYGLKLDSTGDEVLAEYKTLPVIQKIRDARRFRKAASTYGNNWIEKYVYDGDQVVCNWNVTGAETGRMSSDSPNLQNIPARKMPVFRTLFIPRYDKMVIADVSQQEPRLTAMVSKDKNLINAFINKEDIHLFVARMLFDDPTIEKSDPRRKIGKEVGLGTTYGLTAIGLTAKLKEVIDDTEMEISEEKSQQYIDRYFERFPRVKSMLDKAVSDGHRNEYVETPYGRRCHINIHAQGWENNCKNAPIQGGGADMTKAWLIKLWENCGELGIRYPVCLVVHDEIVLDVSENELDTYVSLLQKSFEAAIEMLYPDSPVPFEFEYVVGDNWGAKQ